MAWRGVAWRGVAWRGVASLRPDTVFLPFHYGGEQAVNLVTNPALDSDQRDAGVQGECGAVGGGP
ncbi:MAG: hypothetical protein ACRDRH_22680 [Pseudonocardia sp.]